MLDNTSKWSHPRGNTVVPSRWQATRPSSRSTRATPRWGWIHVLIAVDDVPERVGHPAPTRGVHQGGRRELLQVVGLRGLGVALDLDQRMSVLRHSAV